MRRVGLDISGLDPDFKSHALRGIGRYVSELKKYFDNLHPKNPEIGFFDHRELRDNSIVSRLINYLPAGRQTIRQQFVYPFHLGKLKSRFNVLHFPAHMDAPAWSINNYILTVLDLIPLVMKDLYKANNPGFRFKFARWLEIRSIKNAGMLLAISQNTADDIHKVLNVPYEKIVVTHLGVDKRFFQSIDEEHKKLLKIKYKIPEHKKIVISVGGIDPRKNYVSLIESFVKLIEIAKEKKQEPPLLIIVGSIKKDRQYPHLQEIIKNKLITEHILETGFADDMDLPGLYAISNVLFFPSLYEGFGLTPLEAMAAGTPVVSSGSSCMPEVLGEAAEFVNVDDYEGCANKIYDIIFNNQFAEGLREKGKKRASLFTWKKTGAATLAAYERFLKDKR